MFSRLKLSNRILVPGLLAIACFGGLLLWINLAMSRWIYDTQREKTKQLVQSAWSVLDHYGRVAETGQLTHAEAQRAARDAVQRMRYEQNGYFWINDLGPRMIMHPVDPSLNGKDLSDYRDPTGFALFKRMVEVCQQHSEGLVEYLWAKPGSSTPLQKFSYVKLYRPWGWMVGTGIYVEDVHARLMSMYRTVAGVSFLVVVLCLGVALRMARSIALPLLRLAESLRSGSDQVSAAAEQLAAASQNLAEEANTQQQCLQSTSAANNEISSITRMNAEGTRDVVEHTSETARFVAEAEQRMKEMAACMQDIGESSRKVMKIIQVIDGIAFQTNILSLNAAVEAARAGDAGLGFAVVADAVRMLAQRSASAATETQTLIAESVEASKSGLGKIDSVSHAVEGIASSASRIRGAVEKVSGGAEKQTQDVAQVASALKQLDAVSRDLSNTAEQTSAAGVQLAAQVHSIREAVHELYAIVEPGRG